MVGRARLPRAGLRSPAELLHAELVGRAGSACIFAARLPQLAPGHLGDEAQPDGAGTTWPLASPGCNNLRPLAARGGSLCCEHTLVQELRMSLQCQLQVTFQQRCMLTLPVSMLLFNLKLRCV